MQTEIVSVVVITYNSEKTIVETLDSIYNQIYKDIELIVSDDGSQDQTLELTRNWISINKKRFRHVNILEAKNTGVTKNCNRGIFASNGEYIQIIAGDDILLPQAVGTKVDFIKKNDVGVVFCKVEPFGENTENVNKMKAFCENGYRIIEKGYKCQKEHILLDNFIAGPSGGFYKANFIKELNGYDERYPMLEDYPFIYHYLLMGYEINLIDEVLAKYRISNGSLCMGKKSPMWTSQIKFFFHERLKALLDEGKYGYAIKLSIEFVRKRILYAIRCGL